MTVTTMCALYNIETRNTTYAGISSFAYPNPVVNGNYTAWYSENGIGVYNISNGQTRIMGGSSGYMRIVDITSDNVLYTNHSTTGAGYELFSSNQITGEITELTQAHMGDVNVLVRGSDIAWTSNLIQGAGTLFHHNIDTQTTTQISLGDKASKELFIGNYLICEVDPNLWTAKGVV